MTNEAFKERLKNNPFLVLSDLVYEYILDAIVESEYRPGTKINSKKIADDLGISRTPIRAALTRLTEENLVEQVGEKGYRISELDWNDCLKLYDIRQVIEGSAAYIAANTISEEQLNILAHSINILKKAKDDENDEASFEADNLFHKTIVEATGNDYLIAMYKALTMPLRRFQNALRYTGKYSIKNDNSIIEKHIVIYKALKNSYSQVARDEIENHLGHIYRIIFGYRS